MRSRKKIISSQIDKKSIFKSKTSIIIFSVLLIAIIYILTPQGSDKWDVSSDGILSYPGNRGNVDVKVLKTEKGHDFTLETISFLSKNYTVSGLLRIPVSKNKVPGIMILPGAGVPMEGTETLAGIFSNLGYASLGIEQRNRGGINIEYDYELWKNGNEPVEHKMVFDALRAIDVLRQDPRIDQDRIAIVGESNGGRFAIIAGSMEPKISGIIGISTSGYDTESQIKDLRDENLIRFYRSIDPDSYLASISPGRFVMIHSSNDTIIPIKDAQRTFQKAKEPKQFYTVATGGHGFSEGMKEPLENELKLILKY